ncbi:hypothetical protein AAVH_34932 [Aphelenchoides avenae]|nr:hypothetical protein AAVH_34932 [Aphelenchus avenae]
MLPELRYELLFYYTRDNLERLQPLSRSLLNMIVAGSNVLPLRPIHRVDMGSYFPEDKIRIFVEPLWAAPEPDYEASIDDAAFAEIVRRLQHTCIKKFWVGLRDSPFLRYWRAREAAAFAVVNIRFRLADDTDYGVLDSIVNHLRPTATKVHIDKYSWQENGDNDTDRKYLELLVRESFLTNLQTCRLTVWDEAFPPPSFILEEPGYRNYEIDCVYTGEGYEAADKIDGFIESFVRDGCANKSLESVCFQWYDPDGQQSPALKQLKKPTKVDLHLPKNDLTKWITCEFHRVTKCETYSLINKNQWKRMELVKWTVEYDEDDDRHTAHVLQCRVENL